MHIPRSFSLNRGNRSIGMTASGTWEELDTPIWRKEEGEEEEWDAVEAYFAYLYRPLPGR
ncbi:hypothetical protein EV426DRAFT_709397 [Tirmania nivea]|nr:hypothetical protein EV426DRAFT_709397 [Tirmania nivea]